VSTSSCTVAKEEIQNHLCLASIIIIMMMMMMIIIYFFIYYFRDPSEWIKNLSLDNTRHSTE